MARNGQPKVPYQRDGKWVGAISYQGRKHWVGTFATKTEWKDAAARLRVHLSEHDPRGDKASTLTFNGFVAEYGWPHRFPNGRTKPSTFDVLAENIKPFLKEFGDRSLAQSLTRSEARESSLRGPLSHHRTARTFISDIIKDELMTANPFSRLGIREGRGRKDIDVISEQDFDDLKRIALSVWGEDYGQVMETLLHSLGDEGWRPGEAFALRWRNIDLENNLIRIVESVDAKGRFGPPKNGQPRDIVLFPETKRRLLVLPRLSDEFVFTGARGRLLLKTRFYYYWKPVQAAWESTRPPEHWLHARLAANPKDHFDPYELRHRAATWMRTPKPHDLGLDPVDVALQLGHTDGGALVMRLYGHPNKELARQRILDAANGWTPPPTQPLPANDEPDHPEGTDHNDR
jgi:integrase